MKNMLAVIAIILVPIPIYILGGLVIGLGVYAFIIIIALLPVIILLQGLYKLLHHSRAAIKND